MHPVVLDLDGSVGPLDRRIKVSLGDWPDRLRFACSRRALRDFGRELADKLPPDAGPVFIGSGDFHHLSLPLIEQACAKVGPVDVVVFDNHPDNMRFPFGVHCGSWVRRALALPGVRHVHVVGITSSDIGLGHAWENYLRPLYSGRLSYWSTGVDVRWARLLGLGHAFPSFDDMGALLQAFVDHMARDHSPIYLSVDKDVLSIEDARTNWDQGVMRESQLTGAIQALRGRIVGCDVTGEVSVARYRQWWKRVLSSLDQQSDVPADELADWQAQQHVLNLRLLQQIQTAWRPHGRRASPATNDVT